MQNEDDTSSPEFVEAANRIRRYSIGFVLLDSKDGIIVRKPAGSGTLVSAGGRKGILTAAHVAEALVEHGKMVGLLRFLDNPSTLQRLKIDMNTIKSFPFGSKPFDQNGPDLAFMSLSFDTISSLEITNVFFNLDKRAQSIIDQKFELGTFQDCIAGVVAERTYHVQSPAVADEQIPFFEASFEPGCSTNLETSATWDRIEFTPQIDEGYTAPLSYKGVSGAALWRVAFMRCASGHVRVAEEFIYGVAYFETDIVDQTRTIICHGPASIYRNLLSHLKNA